MRTFFSSSSSSSLASSVLFMHCFQFLQISTRFEARWHDERVLCEANLSSRFYYIWPKMAATNLLLLLLPLLLVVTSHLLRLFCLLENRNSNWLFHTNVTKIFRDAIPMWFEIAIHSNRTAQTTKPTSNNWKNEKEEEEGKIIKTKIDTRSHETAHTTAHSFTWNIFYDFTAIFIHFG